MGYKWLKDLDLIQIKAMLWAGDSPRDISRRYLITQGTVSNIKNGRMHYDIAWPDGSNGPMPDIRASELMRLKKMGMLRSSEIREGRVTGIGAIKRGVTPLPEPVDTRSKEERWKDAVRSTSPEYTEEQLQQGWIEHEKDREDRERVKEEQRRAARDKAAREQEEYEQTLPEETPRERAEWEADKHRRWCRTHLFDRKGNILFDNLLGAELTDEELAALILSDPRARSRRDQLEDWARARMEHLTVEGTDTSGEGGD